MRDEAAAAAVARAPGTSARPLRIDGIAGGILADQRPDCAPAESTFLSLGVPENGMFFDAPCRAPTTDGRGPQAKVANFRGP